MSTIIILSIGFFGFLVIIELQELIALRRSRKQFDNQMKEVENLWKNS